MGALGDVSLSASLLIVLDLGMESGGLAGPLPEAMRGCSSALHGGEERPVKLEWRKPRQ